MEDTGHRPFHKKQPPPSAVPSFGEYLRRERELREITLREISDHTKISYRYLEALEKDNPDKLPAEVFVKGFIRSYARYIGLDTDEAILRFQEFEIQRSFFLFFCGRFHRGDSRYCNGESA